MSDEKKTPTNGDGKAPVAAVPDEAAGPEQTPQKPPQDARSVAAAAQARMAAARGGGQPQQPHQHPGAPMPGMAPPQMPQPDPMKQSPDEYLQARWAYAKMMMPMGVGEMLRLDTPEVQAFLNSIFVRDYYITRHNHYETRLPKLLRVWAILEGALKDACPDDEARAALIAKAKNDTPPESEFGVVPDNIDV